MGLYTLIQIMKCSHESCDHIIGWWSLLLTWVIAGCVNEVHLKVLKGHSGLINLLLYHFDLLQEVEL